MTIRTMKNLAKFAEENGFQVQPSTTETHFYIKNSEGRKFKVSIHVDYIKLSELRTEKNRGLSNDELVRDTFYNIRLLKRVLSKMA